MPVAHVAKFERFFRVAAGLDVDKSDLRRYSDFIDRKINHLLVAGQAAAKANLRDVLEPHDLPVTKGLQESIHAFERLEEAGELERVLGDLAAPPPLDVAVSAEAEARLAIVAGGLSLALARTFRLVDPNVKNPASEDWERVFRVFDLLL
jgi:Domain of unknown function (DUF1931)